MSVGSPPGTGTKGYIISRDLRINQMIRIPQVRVVDEEGNQLGVMPTPRALEMAQERGYDLVEVAPMAAPPVVRFLDFGQYKYELTKREKEAKRRQRAVTFKEVRLTPKIGQGDFDTKVHRAIEFLEDGDRIKVTVRFRGRELTHPELGRAMLTRFTDRIKEHGVVERAPLLEGKSMHLTVASTHKPKGQEPVSARPAGEPKPARPAGEPTPASTQAPAPAAARPAQPAPAEPGPDGEPTKPVATEATRAEQATETKQPKEPKAAAKPVATRPQAAAAAKPAAEPKRQAPARRAASKPAGASATTGE
ncbi:MAG TPA: translation initiation factor IF-3 [Candidatus Limnocylindrales bacterium]|jgi:translation initiation factor IF-3|nr:translation initiation factor IF-3 [Candidatus Limnocylindrales bacterium]